MRASRDELVAGNWEELMADSEEVFAFQRMLGDARSVTLVNWTDQKVAYEPALVAGLELAMGSLGGATAGELRPLEATIWTS